MNMSVLEFVRRLVLLLAGLVAMHVTAQTCPILGSSNNFAVSKTGVGTGLITTTPAGVSCGPQCAATFATNAALTVSATPDPGSIFSGWSGNCAGSGTSTFALTTNTSCTANFDTFPFPTWTPAIPVVPPSTTGITYYVDGTNGNDANNGKSLAASFKTIAKALAVLAAGDTVLIRKGLYREPIDLNATHVPSGTVAKPITFGSYGDGEVIVDGSAKVTGWTLVSGTVWKAPLTFNPIGIVVNEVPLKQVTQGQGGSTAPQVGVAGVTSGSGKWHSGGAGGFITADMGSGVDPNTADIVVPNNVPNQAHVFFYQHNYLTFKGLTIRGSGSNGIWGYGSNITVESCNIKFNGKSAVSFLPTSGVQTADNVVLTSHIYQNVLSNWPRGNNFNAEAGGGWPATVNWSTQLRGIARGNIVHMNGGEGIASYGTTTGTQSGSALFEQNVAYDNWSVNIYFDNQPNNTARNNFIFNHPIDYQLATTNFLYVSNTLFPYNQLGKYSVCLMIADEQNSSDSTNNNANLNNTSVYNNIMANCRIGIRDYSEGAITQQNHGLKNAVITNNTIIMPQATYPNSTIYGMFLTDNANRNVNTVIANNVIYGYNNDFVVYSERTGPLTGITLDNNVYFSPASTPFGSGNSVQIFYNFANWKLNVAGSDINTKFLDPLLISPSTFLVIGTSAFNYNNADLQSSSPAQNAGVVQPRAQAVNFRLQPRVGATWNVGAF